jgi:phosphoglucomutase
MKGDKPTKDYIKGLKYSPPQGGPRPGSQTRQVSIPAAVANPPTSKVGIPGEKRS